MFWDKRIEVKAAVLAEQLMIEFVDKPMFALPPERHPTTEALAALQAKLRLYQFAAVLLAVMTEEQKSAEYAPLRTELERRFLPPTFAQGANMLDELRSAMASLSDLMTPRQNPHHLSWSLKWLESVGIDESNPVVLHSFGMHCLSLIHI